MSTFEQMAYRRVVDSYYNRARKLNHKNKIPRLCAQNYVLNQNHASEAKLKNRLLDEIELERKEII